MTGFDIAWVIFACLLVTGPVFARKLLDRLIDWHERRKFNRLVDRVGESGR